MTQVQWWKLTAVEAHCNMLREKQDTINTTFGGLLFSNSAECQDTAILRDFKYVVEKYETFHRAKREQLNYEASMASLKESRLGIQQNQRVKRLTQLAFVFITSELCYVCLWYERGGSVRRWSQMVDILHCCRDRLCVSGCSIPPNVVER